ncbi:hypothetical protein [Runella sp.]|uniref:hypothetical protein n=1 Tax=Runella sp. TaxID=1960881 RepID=UPI003D1466F0
MKHTVQIADIDHHPKQMIGDPERDMVKFIFEKPFLHSTHTILAGKITTDLLFDLYAIDVVLKIIDEWKKILFSANGQLEAATCQSVQFQWLSFI